MKYNAYPNIEFFVPVKYGIEISKNNTENNTDIEIFLNIVP